jgi:hypoxanthine phosphoribosyltransferase
VRSEPIPLFSKADIAARIEALANAIVSAPQTPEIVTPILVGSFVFAADLLRALAGLGLVLPIEFLWLRSYGAAREGAANVSVLLGPSVNVRGRRVLLIDGVLDHGRTLAKAQELLAAAGAVSVTTAVAVDKSRKDAVLRADYAAFAGVSGFIVGYGMDDAGDGRGLPYIGVLA